MAVGLPVPPTPPPSLPDTESTITAVRTETPLWVCVRCTDEYQLHETVPLNKDKPFAKRKCKPCDRGDRKLQRWFKQGIACKKSWEAQDDEYKVN